MKNYWKILGETTELAMKDLDFRKRLLENANNAIKGRFNENLPAKAIFHESDPKHLVFVLPLKEKIVKEGEELDEDSLESVAGGKGNYDAGTDINMSEPGNAIAIYACFPDVKK